MTDAQTLASRRPTPLNTTALLNSMVQHQGSANGISAEALAAKLGVPGRQLRRLISAAREDGHAICGHPNAGYYMPASVDELQEACQFLRRRAMHTLRKLRRMRQLAMPLLQGQRLISGA